MTTWFISDTHFGEQPARRRKLSGLDATSLDALIERNWRERVASDDVVWHLGDIGKNWRLLADLPGVKHLILAHASDRRPAIRNSAIFASIHETHLLPVSSGALFLIHNPDDCPPDVRDNVVHGHHHYDPPRRGHRSVCVDHIGWAPISLDELLQAKSGTQATPCI